MWLGAQKLARFQKLVRNIFRSVPGEHEKAGNGFGVKSFPALGA
jgi:hypothetical protein